ncbi:MAG: hypothetical protein ABW186_02310 [Rhodanobacteraceae bacterium]
MIEPTDESLRAWLLGRLPPADAEALEQRVLGDDAFGERLADVENDLLDDLAAERLAGDERAVALARFTATPRARLRLRVARALVRLTPRDAAHASRRASRPGVRRAHRPRGWLAGALGAAAAIAIAVVGLNLRAPIQGTRVATITLLADRQRGIEDQTIAVPRDAVSVRLQLEVDDTREPTRFALEIEDAGRAVFSTADLVPQTAGAYRFVEAEVPRRVLANGERIVRVRAGDAFARAWTLRIRDE